MYRAPSPVALPCALRVCLPAQGYPPPAPYGGYPPPAYGAPPPAYGAPPPGYGAPAPGYGVPPPGYGAPYPGGRRVPLSTRRCSTTAPPHVLCWQPQPVRPLSCSPSLLDPAGSSCPGPPALPSLWQVTL